MTATPARASDADLAVDAAAGEVGAYASLYHRHIEAAWRLAQATAAAADGAAKATTNGFVATLRLVGRGRDDVADQFRLNLLAAVYREAHFGSDQPSPPRPHKQAAPDAAGAGPRLVAAFGRLPSRWRAALWLQDVERLPATAAGPILGVSSAAAVQLRKRAWAGLEHRVLQAGGNLPLPDLAPTLAATVAPVPAAVRARSEAKWKRAVARDRRPLVGAGGWLSERAPGPLAACAVGLCAVGIIGLGLIGQNTVRPVGPTRSVAASPPPSGGGGVAGGRGAPSAGTGGASNATGATAGATASNSSATQGPHLVAAPTPAPAVVTVPTTVAPVVVTVPPTVPPVADTVPSPPPTVPPVTLPPVTGPPVTAPPVPPPPVAAAQPVLQLSLNTGVVGVNVGLGTGGCTGLHLLTVNAGCTNAPPGLTLGGTLLGGK